MLSFAFSPCPNDTFVFDALVHGKISTPITLSPILHDIDLLNQYALKGKYSVSKISAYCLGKVAHEYVMLPTGAAIGYGMGPKLVARSVLAISESVIAIPGELTTAHLLFQLLVEQPKKLIFLPYHQIVSAILDGRCDAGVIIHETRFTYQNYGLFELLDLGTAYSLHYKSPIPLGVIVAKRNLGQKILQEITCAIQASIAFAHTHPQSSRGYVQQWSQEKNNSIIDQHIACYVNEQTYEMQQEATQSIQILFQAAIERQLLHSSALEFLLALS